MWQMRASHTFMCSAVPEAFWHRVIPLPHVPAPLTLPQGAGNSTCFRKLARFYAKDVKLMFPTLYSEWGGEEAGPAAAAAAADQRRQLRAQLRWH